MFEAPSTALVGDYIISRSVPRNGISAPTENLALTDVGGYFIVGVDVSPRSIAVAVAHAWRARFRPKKFCYFFHFYRQSAESNHAKDPVIPLFC